MSIQDPVNRRLNQERAKVFPPRVLAVLADPEVASAFRVFDDKEEAHGWTGVGADAKRVAKVFADPKNFADKYLCIFHPDAAFEFRRDEDEVRVVCCFSCTEIEVSLNGDITGYIAMEQVRDEVLALVKSFFGHDPYIKKIPDKSR